MAALPELHIWRDPDGRPLRVEFRDGEQRMELRHVSKVITTDDANFPRPQIELQLIAKPIYHDDGEPA